MNGFKHLLFHLRIAVFAGFTWLFVLPANAVVFGLNDVSILLPLPANGEATAGQTNEMLSPLDDGGGGPLLPASVYARLGTLINGVDPQDLYSHQLKVVSIRIDPCFLEGTSTNCRRQIRLVWQPVLETNGQAMTQDAAVHTFYDFSPTEWQTVLSSWSQLAEGDLSAPLQVHPVLKNEGYRGSRWSALKKLILSFCGERTLTRATAMRLNQNRMWTFLGFDQSELAWTPIHIQHTPSTVEVFVLTESALSNLNEFDGTIAPTVDNEALLNNFLLSSVNFKSRRPESDAKKLMNQMIQLENPILNNPGTVDCASCHVSQSVKFWGERNFPNWNWAMDFGTSLFASSRPLLNDTANPGQANQLRAFGYLGSEPIFSQRVINETAKIADELSSFDLL